MKGKLTDRQQECFDFIKAYQEVTQRPPSFRVIAKQLGINSTNAVACLLRAIERKGYIIREFAQANGIQVIQEPCTYKNCYETNSDQASKTSL